MWIWFAVTSAIFSAIAAISEKKALQSTPALTFSFFLSIANLILSLPFIIFILENPPGTTALIIIFIKSFLGALSFLMVMNAIKKLQLSSALPLLVLTPGLVGIFAWILLGEQLNQVEIGGMVLLLAGTYLLQIGDFNKVLEPVLFIKKNKAYWFIIAALSIFTFTSILDKLLVGKYKTTPETFLLTQHFFMAFFFTLIILTRESNRKEIKLHIRHSWKIVFIIAFLTIIYRYSHIWAIKTGSVALALSVKRTSVFFATLIGGHLFREENVVYKSIAAAIMIGGAILLILY